MNRRPVKPCHSETMPGAFKASAPGNSKGETVEKTMLRLTAKAGADLMRSLIMGADKAPENHVFRIASPEDLDYLYGSWTEPRGDYADYEYLRIPHGVSVWEAERRIVDAILAWAEDQE